MNTEERISSFISLGIHLGEFAEMKGKIHGDPGKKIIASILGTAAEKAEAENPWFTRENVLTALNNISNSLREQKISRFIQPYSHGIEKPGKPQMIGVVMAGNIPLAGFHDFFCTLLTGHHFLGKLSSDDPFLLPAIAEALCAIHPGFGGMITFSENKLSGFNAVIATGSNNTNRYFEYYFGKYPHILRKTRSGIAVLTGKETPEEISGLAGDIFTFFGRGCRSVSKLYVPDGYDLDQLAVSLKKYHHLANHNKYHNNYTYNKAIFLLDNVPFIDCGNLILVENSELASPVSVVFYEFYNDPENLREKVAGLADRIQCIVCADECIQGSVRPGFAQQPELWDFADGVDTMQFLLGLERTGK